jgi:formate hydrogenlyase subunit 4
MDRRDIARYMVWRHVVSWLLALGVLVAVFFVGTGQGPSWVLLLVVGFALFVVTPVLYLLVRRVTADRE